MRKYLGWVNWGGKSGSTIPWSGVPDCLKRRKWVEYQHWILSDSWLRAQSPAALRPATRLLHHDALLKVSAKSNPSFPKLIWSGIIYSKEKGNQVTVMGNAVQGLWRCGCGLGEEEGVLEAKPGNEKALPIQSSTLPTDIMSSLMGTGVSYETTSNSNEGERIFKGFF